MHGRRARAEPQRAPAVLLREGKRAAGRLVAPFDVVLNGDGAYDLVCRDTAANSPKVVAFCE